MGLAAVLTSFLALGSASGAKPKSPSTAGGATSKPSAPPSEPANACGCYKNAKGACVCTDKKGKCECPGECEPVGCGEKREKEMEREMAAEVKRAQQQDAEEKKRKAAEEAAERGELAPDGGPIGASPGETPPPASPPGKKPQGVRQARPDEVTTR